jgi:hypothetical protein
VSWLLHRPVVPESLSLSSGLSVPWDTTILKLGQLIPLQWPLENKSQSIQQTSLLSYFKKLPQPPQPSATISI